MITLKNVTVILETNKIVSEAEVEVEEDGSFWYVDEDGEDHEVFMTIPSFTEKSKEK